MVFHEHKGSRLSSPAETAGILRAFLSREDPIGQEREHFWCIGLDVKNSVRYVELASLGTLSSSLIHPREIFRNAVHNGVAVLIMGHNHPSGDVNPSREDRHVTEKLKAAGELLDIPVIDHVIIGTADGAGFYSFKEQGFL
jgi:DNA repair protein RadC